MLTRFKNLRLRFIEVEGDGAGGGSEPVVTDQQTTVEQGDQSQSQGNPAWDTLRTKLDPISFRAIQDDLKAMDSAAQARVTSVNEQYKPWKQFADAGLTPAQIQQSVTIAQQLNEKPEEIYEALGTFLERNGRLPNKQELKQEVAEQQTDPDAAATPTLDPRFETLEQQQQAIMQFLQNQQKVEIDKAADAAIDSETKALRAAHAELTDDDEKEVIRRAVQIAQTTGKAPTLEEAYADFNALRTRILSTPRPGDSAPTLLPTSGGVPTGGNQKSLGQLTRDETQALMADLLEKNKQ